MALIFRKERNAIKYSTQFIIVWTLLDPLTHGEARFVPALTSIRLTLTQDAAMDAYTAMQHTYRISINPEERKTC